VDFLHRQIADGGIPGTGRGWTTVGDIAVNLEEVNLIHPLVIVAQFLDVGNQIARCRRDLCWNLIGGLRSDEDTWSGSKVNRVIGEFLGQAVPSVDFAHSDLT